MKCVGADTVRFNEVISIIDTSLYKHNLPIVVSLHHPYYNKDTDSWYTKCDSNNPKAINHYCVIVGKHYDSGKDKHYYRFYEVGTSSDSNAKSLSNRLYINRDIHMIVGKTACRDNEEYYTVIAVRKNIGQTL